MATIGVSPEGALTAGGTATVSVSNGPVSTTVTITINNGADQPDIRELEITLDANGNGSAPWSVPTDWDMALFNGLNAETVTRPIVQP